MEKLLADSVLATTNPCHLAVMLGLCDCAVLRRSVCAHMLSAKEPEVLAFECVFLTPCDPSGSVY